MHHRKKGRDKRRQSEIWAPPEGRWPYLHAVYAKPDWDLMLFHPRPRFPDFDFITPSLATGGFIKNEAELDALRAAGITHVVNTSSEVTDEGQLFADSGIEFLFNPTYDDYHWKDPEWFDRTANFAAPAIRNGGKVLAHCLEGVNRGPSSAYYVLRVLGMDGDEAFAMIKGARARAKVFYREDADHAWGKRVA